MLSKTLQFGDLKKRGALILVVTSTLCLLLSSCQQEITETEKLSEQEVALVSLAHSQHVITDIALEQEDYPKALNSLETIIENTQNSGLNTPVHFEVGLDAYLRVSRIYFERSMLKEAEDAARQGLEWSSNSPPLIHRGHLFQVLGDILRLKGDPHGSINAHEQAVKQFKAILDQSR